MAVVRGAMKGRNTMRIYRLKRMNWLGAIVIALAAGSCNKSEKVAKEVLDPRVAAIERGVETLSNRLHCSDSQEDACTWLDEFRTAQTPKDLPSGLSMALGECAEVSKRGGLKKKQFCMLFVQNSKASIDFQMMPAYAQTPDEQKNMDYYHRGMESGRRDAGNPVDRFMMNVYVQVIRDAPKHPNVVLANGYYSFSEKPKTKVHALFRQKGKHIYAVFVEMKGDNVEGTTCAKLPLPLK